MIKHRSRILTLAVLLVGIATSATAVNMAFEDKFSSLNTSRWYVSNGWTNGPHQSCEWRAENVATEDNKLLLTLSDNGGKVRPIGCAEIHTTDRLGYGLYQARLRTAAGSGLNTAFFTYIGPPHGVPEWDEIDFEFLGKDPSKVEVNHYAQGKLIKGKVVDLGFDSSREFHDYAFDWTKDTIIWLVDGKEVYKTPPGVSIPRNPGYLFLSLWSGSAVEDAWMGPFSYSKPVTAEIASARFVPHE